MGAALENFLQKFDGLNDIPVGKPFSIKITDKEATDAAREYITENKEWIKKQLKALTGLSLSVEEPFIKFQNDELSIAVKGGVGFLKANASLTSEVKWNSQTGKPEVNVRSVKLPVVSVSPEKLNSVVEKPLDNIMAKVKEYGDIHSLKLSEGLVVMDAVKTKDFSPEERQNWLDKRPQSAPQSASPAPNNNSGNVTAAQSNQTGTGNPSQGFDQTQKL